MVVEGPFHGLCSREVSVNEPYLWRVRFDICPGRLGNAAAVRQIEALEGIPCGTPDPDLRPVEGGYRQRETLRVSRY